MLGNLKTPDITLAQVLAAVTWLVLQLVAMGVIDDETSQLMIQVASTVISATWVVADAIIRNGRARALINPPKPLEPDQPLDS